MDPRIWSDCNVFYLNLYPQGSEGWLHARSQLDATTSIFNKVRMYVENRGPKPDKTPFEPNEAMKLGTTLEPYLRDWFGKKSGYLAQGSQIIELGLVVPKFCERIGASVDGLIIENGSPTGIIEIKTTRKLYDSILTREGNQENYILPSHYDQIQGALACLGLPWCYYILYEHTTNTIHVEKITRNVSYWDNVLYPAILKYIRMNSTN